MIADISTVKLHLRVDSTAEDTLIGVYMAAAEDYIENYIDGPIPLVPEPEDYAEEAPWPVTVYPSVVAAFLLLVGDMYENRESQIIDSTIKDNPAVQRLLYPYRLKLGV